MVFPRELRLKFLVYCLTDFHFQSLEITIYPQYSNDGGIDSERTFVKQLVQRFVKDSRTDDESMFNEDEIEQNDLDDDYLSN